MFGDNPFGNWLNGLFGMSDKGMITNSRGQTTSAAGFSKTSVTRSGDKYTFGQASTDFDAIAAWKTGSPVGLLGAVDPFKALEETAKFSSVRERAQAGEGMGGLFGFSKILGTPPPFSIPPLPKLGDK